MSLKRLNIDKVQANYFFPKSSSSLNKHIFVKAKGCAFYEKSAYYEWAQYLSLKTIFIIGPGSFMLQNPRRRHLF